MPLRAKTSRKDISETKQNQNQSFFRITQIMQLKVINKPFTICKVKDYSQTDLTADYVGKIDEELSLVCETALALANTTEREDGWRALQVLQGLGYAIV